MFFSSFFFPLRKFRVSGHSMEPYLKPGDQVIATSILGIKKGDVVVFKYHSKYLIKRISKIKRTKVYLEGDNKSDSMDSRKFGEIEKYDIIGKVIFKI